MSVFKVLDAVGKSMNDTGKKEQESSLKESDQLGQFKSLDDVKNNSPWSSKITDHIRSAEEANLYKEAGLVEAEVGGKPALIQPNIDGTGKMNSEGWMKEYTNKDLTEIGYPPRDSTGKPMELHHIGQDKDSPLAELTPEQHRSNGNNTILHTFEDSKIDRKAFNAERMEYWKERSESL